jgi:hypothetical protein
LFCSTDQSSLLIYSLQLYLVIPPLHFRYTIDDIPSEAKFIVNAKLGICFEQTQCIFKTDILKDVFLAKPFCNWDAGYLIEGTENLVWYLKIFLLF